MKWFARLRTLFARWRRQLALRRSLGARGERAAARLLRRRGYRIVARGFRLRDRGEIDLVAVDGRTVVFVEVKTRRGDARGRPAEAVDARKQRRLTRLATAFLRRHDLLGCSARFDVVAVTWPADRGRPAIEHIPHAFEAVELGRGAR